MRREEGAKQTPEPLHKAKSQILLIKFSDAIRKICDFATPRATTNRQAVPLTPHERIQRVVQSLFFRVFCFKILDKIFTCFILKKPYICNPQKGIIN